MNMFSNPNFQKQSVNNIRGSDERFTFQPDMPRNSHLAEEARCTFEPAANNFNNNLNGRPSHKQPTPSSSENFNRIPSEQSKFSIGKQFPQLEFENTESKNYDFYSINYGKNSENAQQQQSNPNFNNNVSEKFKQQYEQNQMILDDISLMTDSQLNETQNQSNISGFAIDQRFNNPFQVDRPSISYVEQYNLQQQERMKKMQEYEEQQKKLQQQQQPSVSHQNQQFSNPQFNGNQSSNNILDEKEIENMHKDMSIIQDNVLNLLKEYKSEFQQKGTIKKKELKQKMVNDTGNVQSKFQNVMQKYQSRLDMTDLSINKTDNSVISNLSQLQASILKGNTKKEQEIGMMVNLVEEFLVKFNQTYQSNENSRTQERISSQQLASPTSSIQQNNYPPSQNQAPKFSVQPPRESDEVYYGTRPSEQKRDSQSSELTAENLQKLKEQQYQREWEENQQKINKIQISDPVARFSQQPAPHQHTHNFQPRSTEAFQHQFIDKQYERKDFNSQIRREEEKKHQQFTQETNLNQNQPAFEYGNKQRISNISKEVQPLETQQKTYSSPENQNISQKTYQTPELHTESMKRAEHHHHQHSHQVASVQSAIPPTSYQQTFQTQISPPHPKVDDNALTPEFSARNTNQKHIITERSEKSEQSHHFGNTTIQNQENEIRNAQYELKNENYYCPRCDIEFDLCSSFLNHIPKCDQKHKLLLQNDESIFLQDDYGQLMSKMDKKLKKIQGNIQKNLNQNTHSLTQQILSNTLLDLHTILQDTENNELINKIIKKLENSTTKMDPKKYLQLHKYLNRIINLLQEKSNAIHQNSILLEVSQLNQTNASFLNVSTTQQTQRYSEFTKPYKHVNKPENYYKEAEKHLHAERNTTNNHHQIQSHHHHHQERKTTTNDPRKQVNNQYNQSSVTKQEIQQSDNISVQSSASRRKLNHPELIKNDIQLKHQNTPPTHTHTVVTETQKHHHNNHHHHVQQQQQPHTHTVITETQKHHHHIPPEPVQHTHTTQTYVQQPHTHTTTHSHVVQQQQQHHHHQPVSQSGHTHTTTTTTVSHNQPRMSDALDVSQNEKMEIFYRYANEIKKEYPASHPVQTANIQEIFKQALEKNVKINSYQPFIKMNFQKYN